MVIPAALAATALFCGFVSLRAEGIKPDLYQSLQYRHIGPQGNRTVAVAGVAGGYQYDLCRRGQRRSFRDFRTEVYIRVPIFDGFEVQSIGAISIAHTDPNMVWVGTGETFIRGNISIGNGVYKSTDAGKTWSHMGLDQTGRIARIVIDPNNPDIVFVAAMGHCYRPQTGAGRLPNGRCREDLATRALRRREHRSRRVGHGSEQPTYPLCGHVAIDHPRLGPGERRAWKRAVHVAGWWSHLETSDRHGLPEPPLGKIAVAIAPNNSNRVYALIETGDKGVLWRSKNGGDDWELISRDATLNRRPHYYSRMGVLPDNPNEVYFLTQLALHVSFDGGVTSRAIPAVWPDNHDIWIDSSKPEPPCYR